MELTYNKKVNLIIKGGSNLVEKNVLEALQEPLLHLLRNAFDHGIEKPEIRQQLGKPEKGTIEISASHRGNRTLINIRDDGKGIDLDKIREKAKKMGLQEEDLAQATKKELLDLIFEPGFTTTDKVTNLSGRGIGMNVVRSNLEEIKGEVTVESQPNLGTDFILSVPLTLTVMRVLLVESKKMLLAFPNNQIEEVNLFDPNIVVQSVGQEFLNWEDDMIRLIRLEKHFNFAHSEPILETEETPIINEKTLLIVEQTNNLVAFQVDRYWGEQEVIIRQIEGHLKMPPGFTGCTILGDGRVVPIIDSIEFINWIDEKTAQLNYSLLLNDYSNSSNLEDNKVINNENQPSQNTISPTNKTNIMIVDDSINVRRFLALTLNKANYHVEQAKDGQDALEKLEDFDYINAIICDIEMPRLDGFGFLAHCKSKPNFKNIPVIMLTSRSGEKHRNMAMNLGANAYFSKPFKEKELLTTIKQLIMNRE
jgi:chemosensory pili system protein ChpA (sensor histidine kinase/response regulator)